MTRFGLVLFFILVAGLASGAYLIGKGSATAPVREEVVVPKGAPSFAWSYVSIGGEIPKSELRLTATYEDGSDLTKQVDTIEGSCNEYAEPESDVYAQSQMIICYYAGLGRYYKVTESAGEYLVQRRVFEEASPEYDPFVQEFEVVERF